jgi:GH25 family lysozyme M1 (1,4-beta-N-acetylmuramidase)
VPRSYQIGVDVSHFQRRPRHWGPTAGKISWAAVKITELLPGGRRYVNPYAAPDWAWLHRHRKGRIAYLFGHPSVSPAHTVAFFIREVGRLGLLPHDAVALDLEVTDGRHPAAVSHWALTVLDDLHRRLDRPPLLYTFARFAREGNCARLGHYPLWISDPHHRPGHPAVPRPWHTWAIHQYRTTGPIDRDVANYDSLRAMFAALGKS